MPSSASIARIRRTKSSWLQIPLSASTRWTVSSMSSIRETSRRRRETSASRPRDCWPLFRTRYSSSPARSSRWSISERCIHWLSNRYRNRLMANPPWDRTTGGGLRDATWCPLREAAGASEDRFDEQEQPDQEDRDAEVKDVQRLHQEEAAPHQDEAGDSDRDPPGDV